MQSSQPQVFRSEQRRQRNECEKIGSNPHDSNIAHCLIPFRFDGGDVAGDEAGRVDDGRVQGGPVVFQVFPLTLPTAEAGGILVSSTGCLRVHEGLTGSPQAFGLDVSRPTVCSLMFYAADSSWLRILNPSSLRLLAALTSRSWNTPHCGHVHSRTSRFLTSGLRYPQSWQSWLDG